ncbi:MAG: phage terminase small subunit P27 family [Alphaproteobacteria bacterium]|nr:phage terminase small subunit P27 family [Alphaproteobacteria bacterium]
MARGRKPKPAEVSEAQGNPGRRPKAAPPPSVPTLGSLSAPKELRRADQKAVWEKLAPLLARMNFLRATDQAAMVRYCIHLADWHALTRELKGRAFTYETVSNHGTMERVKPAFLVRERIENRLEKLEDKLGLTPSARQSILQSLASAVPQLPFDAPESKKDADKPAAPAASPIGMLNSDGQAVH